MLRGLYSGHEHLHSHGLLHVAGAVGHEGLPGSPAGWRVQQHLPLWYPGPLLKIQNVQLCMPTVCKPLS